jgi:sugar lactone lactonase YvrE
VCQQTEGLALDPEGNVYADSQDQIGGVGHICVLSPKGELIDIIEVPPGPSGVISLIGEYWHDGHLYVLDGADTVAPDGRLLRIDIHTHTITTYATGFEFPNCVVADRQGNFFVTDSFLGEIFKISAVDHTVSVWLANPVLLSNNPDQPVGANDLAFDREEDALYVDNAGNRQVYRIAINADQTPGAVTLFADGPTADQRLGLTGPVALYYADGMQFDVKGNLYVMSNITDEIEVFAPDGSLVHRYSGIGPNAMDFNASPVFRGRWLFVSNFSNNDNGVGSKVSVMLAPYPGLELPR